jgi:hypothetical protein
MPNPTTIEELLKMKPCPFEDGQKITGENYEWFSENYPCIISDLCVAVYTASLGEVFKMPDGYYHLPIGMNLGLPLGEWTLEDLHPLINVLPFGVLKQYLARTGIAVNYYGGSLEASDLTNYRRMINILKQPPNLYNPLDHKEEVLMEDNSANEEQPAKETAPMELPWQDISTLDYTSNESLKDKFYYGWLITRRISSEGSDLFQTWHTRNGGSIIDGKTHWCPITPPKASTLEVPVEPEIVSIRDFKKDPHGKFYTLDGIIYREFIPMESVGEYAELLFDVYQAGYLIYATKPTTWLAWKAEEESEKASNA